MAGYPKKRNMDGVYFRVERDGKWENICFTDLTDEERRKACEGRSNEWLESLIRYLADLLREIEDDFDLVITDD